MMHVIILDVGTSSMVASVYSSAGKCLFSTSKEYSAEFIYPSMVEQDPLIWKDAAFETLNKTALFSAQKNIDISAIAVTSQRASLIAVDKDGEPMRKAIMWQDKRTAKECEKMEKHISMREMYKKTGLRLSPYAVLPRIIWLKENEKDIFNKAYRLMGVQDFVIHSLTGQYKTDWTQAARTMLMDIKKFSWDDDLLNIAGISKDKICELVPPGSAAGGLTEYAAHQTGLKSGLPVIICGGDQQNAAVGLNVIKPGVAEANTGTGSFIIAHAERPVFDDDCRLICSASAIGGKWITEASIFNSGAILKWFKEQFYRGAYTYDAMCDDADASSAGANGVMLLVHFEGSGAPYWEAKAKGMFFNLSLGTKREDMCRAILEGISLEILDNLALFEKNIGKLNKISVAGGMTKSNLFAQLQADAFGMPVVRYQNSEATSLGAAIIAMTALSEFDSAEKAAESILEKRPEIFYPVKSKTEIYKKLLQKKRSLFYALKNADIYDIFMESV